MKWLITVGYYFGKKPVLTDQVEVEAEFRHEAIRMGLSKTFKKEMENIPYPLWIDAVEIKD